MGHANIVLERSRMGFGQCSRFNYTGNLRHGCFNCVAMAIFLVVDIVKCHNTFKPLFILLADVAILALSMTQLQFAEIGWNCTGKVIGWLSGSCMN